MSTNELDGVVVVYDGEPDYEMGAATYVANAISEGISALCLILDWNDEGASGTGPQPTGPATR